MVLRRLLTVLSTLLVATACQSDPPLPDGRVLTGSDWIPGRSKTSFITGGEPVVIENIGEHEIRIGSGPDAVLLAPGATHETDGTDTEIHNPAGDRARVQFHAAGTPGSSVDVVLRRGSEARQIRATHGGAAVRTPAGAGRVIDDPH